MLPHWVFSHDSTHDHEPEETDILKINSACVKFGDTVGVLHAPVFTWLLSPVTTDTLSWKNMCVFHLPPTPFIKFELIGFFCLFSILPNHATLVKIRAPLLPQILRLHYYSVTLGKICCSQVPSRSAWNPVVNISKFYTSCWLILEQSPMNLDMVSWRKPYVFILQIFIALKIFKTWTLTVNVICHQLLKNSRSMRRSCRFMTAYAKKKTNKKLKHFPHWQPL